MLFSLLKMDHDVRHVWFKVCHRAENYPLWLQHVKNFGPEHDAQNHQEISWNQLESARLDQCMKKKTDSIRLMHDKTKMNISKK